MPPNSLPQLPERSEDAHKGTFGTALLVGGSRGMSGAIAMAGMAAMRMGAGLVRLAVPDRCLETIAGFSPCLMTTPVTDDAEGRIAASPQEIIALLDRVSCVALGPGMGKSDRLERLFDEMLPRLAQNVVIDADGLNNLAALGDWPQRLPSDATAILTPHPGEWERLSQRPAKSRNAQVEAAKEIAVQHSLVIVLKGHRSVVTDGHRTTVNSTGTPALATGGSGDVLTGIITGLVCQGMAPFEAAQLGVWLHGKAGELAAAIRGAHVVLPTEVIDRIPVALHASRQSAST
jgi:ADP-dependent NAD(P)H-hydrate dehydratase